MSETVFSYERFSELAARVAAEEFCTDPERLVIK